MMTFSKPRKSPMVVMATNDENTPHSPNDSGVYKRVRMGVTMMGSMYMIMLLTDILAVFLTSGLENMSVNFLFKT